MPPGITGYGAYIPSARLLKSAIAEANSWFDASLKSLGRGQRAMCNWDEDVITMGVEAAQACLQASPGLSPARVFLASTTFPFIDRQNSTVLVEALNLPANTRAMDIGGSQRAATSGLVTLLESGAEGDSLLVAAEHRRTRAGSRYEMLWGDAAACVSVGGDAPIAECLGFETVTVDFVDHYRGEEQGFDYDWEERWVRDAGFMQQVPPLVQSLLGKAGLNPGDVDHFIFPTDQARTPAALAKKLGIPADAVVDNQIAEVGVAGAAQPILLLVKALQQAQPGQVILVVGFGQGCDAVLFLATDAITGYTAAGVQQALASGREEPNYNKFLAFNNLVERDLGKRGEVDKQTFLSGYNRRKDLLTAFTGGKCRECGTVQIPREKYCVNPDCNALDSQDTYAFADKHGEVVTWTADRLTFDWSPPAYFGMVKFDGGGKLMMDFTEVQEGSIDSGARVSVHFRIRQFDPQRGFRKYFWKAKVLPD